mmetsp:Transcript_6726/g.18503  ORF Transcript_6726/g.18503 Transcript_6726/m.18503 type:complete len:494 (-) Transcript_6726:28-1509(-)
MCPYCSNGGLVHCQMSRSMLFTFAPMYPLLFALLLGFVTPESCPASHPNIQFVGRYRKAATGVSFDHPGFKIIVRVTGTASLSARMSRAGTVSSAFVVFCDGHRVGFPSTFNTSSWPVASVMKVRLCSGLDPKATHDVVLLKSTEAAFLTIAVLPNYITFAGLDGSSGGEARMVLLPPPPKPTRRLEFLGDSIAAGFGTVCHQRPGSSGCDVEDESFAESWVHDMCESFQAQCHVVAWSGWGLVQNCCGGSTLLPDIWRRTLATVADPSDPHGTLSENLWNFSRNWTPQAVLINVGTNDRLGQRPHLDLHFRQTYLRLLLDVAAAYGPSTRFLLACGPMDEAYCAAVQGVAAQASGPPHHLPISLLDHRGFLGTPHGAACCGHPSALAGAAMAKRAVELLQHDFGWIPAPTAATGKAAARAPLWQLLFGLMLPAVVLLMLLVRLLRWKDVASWRGWFWSSRSSPVGHIQNRGGSSHSDRRKVPKWARDWDDHC